MKKKTVIGIITTVSLIFALVISFVGNDKSDVQAGTREKKGYISEKKLKQAKEVNKKTTTKIVPNQTAQTNQQEQISNGKLIGKTIVIDPGHGGSRPGASGFGIVEKELTLDVAKRVKEKLESTGANIIMTRMSDSDCSPGASYELDLKCRPDVATKNHADVFLSIHANSGPSNANGFETFYYDVNRDKTLTDYILENYIKETNLRNRGLKNASFSVLRNSTVPSTLLELGFLTNEQEATKLKSDLFRDKAAEGIANGIIQYLN